MARKKQETLVLFPEVAETTKKMTDAQFGALMRAVFAYRFTGEIYDGDDLAVDIVFGMVAGQVDRYREVCETNRNNAKTENMTAEVQPSEAKCSEIQRNDPPIPSPSPIPYPIPSPVPSPNPIPSPVPDPEPIPYPVPNNGSEAAEPPTPTRFVPPKVSEVREYCRQSGYTGVDPERFVNFYQSKGWKIGRDPMKDWKAAVRGWSSRDRPKKLLSGYEEGEKWTL